MTVLLGAYNLDIKIERGVQQRDVDEIFIHPDWRAFSEKYDADLAIFLLNEMVEFTKYIRPICMPVQNPPVDSQASIVGKVINANAIVRIKMFAHIRLGSFGAHAIRYARVNTTPDLYKNSKRFILLHDTDVSSFIFVDTSVLWWRRWRRISEQR